MIFIKQYISDFLNLLFPDSCVHCGCRLQYDERYLCEKCFLELQLTNYHVDEENELYTLISKEVKICSAFSYVFYSKNNPIHSLIHSLKYKFKKNIGIYLGELYGKILKVNLINVKFDYIIPMPLYKNKKNERSYNQCEYICIGLNEYLDSIIDTTSIVRCKNTKSLTHENYEERKKEIKNAFKIIDFEHFENKNILIVDDVITSGSTMIEICKEILNTVKCNIYVCSIARTKQNLWH